MLMAKTNVLTYLERTGNDFFLASKNLHQDYRRGCYTESEYLEMMDILSSYMMNGIF